MNALSSSLPFRNPFSEPAFWGRRKELETIARFLLSESPRCCAIIGEDTFGKTTLLQFLSETPDMSIIDDSDVKEIVKQLNQAFVFVYLNCKGYGDEVADMKNMASARFWWDLYDAVWEQLQEAGPSRLSKPRGHEEQEYIDIALEIRWELEDLIQNHSRNVVIVLDNFEGIARLPLRDSEWLRSMGRTCTYVVASRDLLYLLYHPTDWSAPSPLWNLFGDPIYLGLPSPAEVEHFLDKACKQARAANSVWKPEDIDYLKKAAGRHPALLRIASAALFEYRLQGKPLSSGKQRLSDEAYLDYSIDTSAGSICMQIWQGLARAELRDAVRTTGKSQGDIPSLSLHQRALLDIAKGHAGVKEARILPELNSAEKQKILFDLEQRNIIDFTGVWCIFSEIMRRFVLKQEVISTPDLPVVRPKEVPGLTYQEKRVYDYLKTYVGEVCSREDIKRAIWQGNEPTDSALQKIIERIREKIEPDAANPRYLLAVRGKGYILREEPEES